jgi:hypothetical protein
MANDNKNEKTVAQQADESTKQHLAEQADKANKEAAQKAKDAKVSDHPEDEIQKGVDKGRFTVEQLKTLQSDPQYRARVINNGEGQWADTGAKVSISESDIENASTFKTPKKTVEEKKADKA